MSKALRASVIGACFGLLAIAADAAAYSGQCATELNGVEAAILGSAFIGQKAGTDQSNLLAKLSAAEAKVQLSKFSDAVDKLMDISDTATALAGAAKPKLADATAINTAVIAAVTCVGAL